MSNSHEESVADRSGRGWVWLSGVLALIGLLGALGGQIFGFVQFRQIEAEQRVWRAQSVERETARQEVALDLTARRAELEKLKIEVARLTQEQKTLRDTKAATAVDAAAEMSKLTDEVAKLTDTRNELTEAEANLRAAQVLKLTAERQHESLIREQATLTARVDELKAERDMLLESVTTDEEKITAQTKQLDDLKKLIVARKAELQTVEREVNLLTRQQESLKSVNLATEMELKPLQDRIKLLSADEASLRMTQTSLRATVQKLTDEKMKFDAAIEELDSKRVSILKEIATNTEKLRSLKKEIAEAEASKDAKANVGPPSTPDAGNGKEQP